MSGKVLISLLLVAITCTIVVQAATRVIKCGEGTEASCTKCPDKSGTKGDCAPACRSYGQTMSSCKLDKYTDKGVQKEVGHCTCVDGKAL